MFKFAEGEQEHKALETEAHDVKTLRHWQCQWQTSYTKGGTVQLHWQHQNIDSIRQCYWMAAFRETREHVTQGCQWLIISLSVTLLMSVAYRIGKAVYGIGMIFWTNYLDRFFIINIIINIVESDWQCQIPTGWYAHVRIVICYMTLGTFALAMPMSVTELLQGRTALHHTMSLTLSTLSMSMQMSMAMSMTN